MAAAAAEPLLSLGNEVKGLSQLAGTIICVISYALIIYARIDDWHNKGR